LCLAIVDGSGVLCDPEGIERSELKRLAHNRLTVSHFDDSKLSPNGFKILIDQQNVKLPSMFVIKIYILMLTL
jgi:glutamate dehydrogenase